MSLEDLNYDKLLNDIKAKEARKKHDQAIVSQSIRIKGYDMSIDWKTKTFVEEKCPGVSITFDSVTTDGWFWKTKEIIFTLTGPRAAVRQCADSIEYSIQKYQQRLLNG